MTVAHILGADPNMPAVNFCCHWEVLMSYTHVVDTNRLTPIWIELVAVARGDFIPTLEDVYRATARRLALPFITHGVADMVREVCFATQDYALLTAGTIAFLFFAHATESDEKLQARARLWYNALKGNVRL